MMVVNVEPCSTVSIFIRMQSLFSEFLQKKNEYLVTNFVAKLLAEKLQSFLSV